MSCYRVACKLAALIAVFLLLLPGLLLPAPATAAPNAWTQFGRLSGTVTDTDGVPLMGATVIITGPALGVPYRLASANERIITDSRGGFTIEHLLPGSYSVRVVSAARIPVLRSGIRVEAGQTAQQKFILGDIFAPLRIEEPLSKTSASGSNWKWVLRTSAATRPVLRYREVARSTSSPAPAKTVKPSLLAGQRLIGMMPGSTRSQALAEDPGMGSVLAYLRPLSPDSDLLVAGSMAAYGAQASSVATAFRHHLMKGDSQELTLVAHRLSFSDGAQSASGAERISPIRAQGVVVNYSRTRRLSDSLTLVGGFEIDYLNALRDVTAARPRVKLEYRVSPSAFLALRYGTIRLDDDSDNLLERIGMLNAFPRVTLRRNHLSLEQVNHTEVSVHRKLGKTSNLELAGFEDYFQNAAVWSLGAPGASAWLAGNLLPNPNSGALILNAGDYRSSGVRATCSVRMGTHLVGAFNYSMGKALTAGSLRRVSEDTQTGFQGVLRPEPSHSFGGKVWTRVPGSKTQVITSYQWLERGRVTGVDPYGQADLQIQPFLGVQIRQPLPTLAFFPAHIEALADFRNLLGQGYVSVPRSEGRPLVLASSYRTLRGGFSLLF